MSMWMPLFLLSVACNGDTDTSSEIDGAHVTGLRLSPSDAKETSTLFCTWEAIEDATEATVAWEINSAVISGLDEPTLDGTWFDKKDKVACIVTAVADGAEGLRSNVVQIEDSKPEVLSVTIGPEEPNENTILHIDVVSEDVDPGDDVRLRDHFRWYVSAGGVDEPEIRGVDEEALGQSYWEKGDVIYAEVWVNGGGGSSERVDTEAITIGNTPPEPPEIEVVEADDLSSITCTITEASIDLDGEAVSYIYVWRRFSVEVALTDAELPFPEEGASYTCTVTPTDGEDEGESVSATIEVSGDPMRYRWIFNDAGARAGQVLVRLPDADSDGRDEILVGTPASSVESVEGGGVVILNSAAVDSATSALAGPAWVYRTLTSPNQKQFFGASLGWTPDLDGDGRVEILVGAPEAVDVERISGLVAIIPSTTWYSTAIFEMSIKAEQEDMWWFPGDYEGAAMGTSVAGMDINGDGVGDILAGALRQHDNDQGTVTVLDGTQLQAGGGALFNEAIMMEFVGNAGGFGSSLVVGDFDGDGIDDLAAGAPTDGADAGVVYVFNDLPNSLPSSSTGDSGMAGPAPILSVFDAWISLEGEAAGDHLGRVMAVGDVDGDGIDDLLLGAEDAASGAGAIYLWVGNSSSTGWRAYVAIGAEGDKMGNSVSVAGDIDGGGIGEVMAGAAENESTYERSGGVYVFSGEDWGASGGTLSAEDATWFLPGEAQGERAGTAVLGTGDIDGDGRPDMAVGIPGVDDTDIGVDVGGVNLWVGVDRL
jgi:hypothetical protein